MKRNLIIDEALKLFLEKSITDVTIKDIASKIEIGEATIYRYFENKENLVFLCAEKLGKLVYEKYFNLSRFETGYQKIEEFYKNYYYIFDNNPSYFRFILQFDNLYLPKNNLNIEEYESLVDSFHNIFMKAYSEGLNDNTIKEIEDIDVFYYSTSKALLELCKKESMGIDLIKQDKLVDKKKIILKLIDIILSSFKE